MSVSAKGKQFYYGYLRSTHWTRFRQQIMKQAGGRCEKCSFRKAYVVHHLHYDTLGHEDPKDVLVLCYECHREMHTWHIPKAANDNEPLLPMNLPKRQRV